MTKDETQLRIGNDIASEQNDLTIIRLWKLFKS